MAGLLVKGFCLVFDFISQLFGLVLDLILQLFGLVLGFFGDSRCLTFGGFCLKFDALFLCLVIVGIQGGGGADETQWGCAHDYRL